VEEEVDEKDDCEEDDRCSDCWNAFSSQSEGRRELSTLQNL
jgi:hypothetical protein